MRFTETIFPDVWVIDLNPAWDSRGFFARTFCGREFAEIGLETDFVQHSTSYSKTKGTLRGMHFQLAPHSETKIVSCRRGAIWDVVIDLRVESPTYCHWLGYELTSENRRQLYIPPGLAHGFQTLSDDAEVYYLISSFYEPRAASGVRYNDPIFAVEWPLPLTVISEQDAAWSDFRSHPAKRA